MAEQNHALTQTYQSEESVNDIEQYRIVVDGVADGCCKLPAAANAGKILGVSSHKAAAGRLVEVVYGGIVYVTAYAAFAKGAVLVIGDTAGRAAAKASGATDQGLGILGIALRAAGAQGDLVPVLLQITSEYAT